MSVILFNKIPVYSSYQSGCPCPHFDYIFIFIQSYPEWPECPVVRVGGQLEPVIEIDGVKSVAERGTHHFLQSAFLPFRNEPVYLFFLITIQYQSATAVVYAVTEIFLVEFKKKLISPFAIFTDQHCFSILADFVFICDMVAGVDVVKSIVVQKILLTLIKSSHPVQIFLNVFPDHHFRLFLFECLVSVWD